jgi:hypothetical protein
VEKNELHNRKEPFHTHLGCHPVADLDQNLR